jgi:GNAT superfamily N-acetyltransferase
MREDLERLGLYDEVWVRQRFMRAFHPENTLIVRVEGSPGAGSIAVRPEPDCQWIEHFYLTKVQGNGVGSAVLAHVLEVHRDERAFRLNALHESRATSLYQRAGFTLDSQDGVDVFLKLD